MQWGHGQFFKFDYKGKLKFQKSDDRFEHQNLQDSRKGLRMCALTYTAQHNHL